MTKRQPGWNKNIIRLEVRVDDPQGQRHMVSWHRTMKGALKKARTVPGSIIVFITGRTMPLPTIIDDAEVVWRYDDEGS